MTDTEKRFITHQEVEHAADQLAQRLPHQWLTSLYGIPRGGVPAAYALQSALLRLGFRIPVVSSPTLATLIVDDLADSGKTAMEWLKHGYKVGVLFSKWSTAVDVDDYQGVKLPPQQWVVFPWETDHEEAGPTDAVRRLLQYMGEDPDDPHLQETPRRVLSWFDQFRRRDPDFVATTFEGVDYDGMVMVRRIPFVSLCAHHLIPFAGYAAVAYIPGRKSEVVLGGPPNVGPKPVIGLSKLARFVQHYASRLQNQEQLTTQIRDAVAEATLAESVAVRISAEHMCMNFRGPRVPGAETVTSSLMGAFRTDPKAREEFYSLAGER